MKDFHSILSFHFYLFQHDETDDEIKWTLDYIPGVEKVWKLRNCCSDAPRDGFSDDDAELESLDVFVFVDTLL